MASAEDYYLTLRQPRNVIAEAFGVRIDEGSAELRWNLDSDLAAVATILKLLVDQGVVTDTQVQTALTAAATGTDGSVWSDIVAQPSGGAMVLDEEFFLGADGDDATEANTAFVRGQVGDSLLPSLGTVTFDTTVHQSGGVATAKTYTVDGWSRALRTDTYDLTSTAYTGFFFNAAAPPATSGCRIFAFQRGPNPGSDVDADTWALELSVDSSGLPTMIDDGTVRGPSTTPPNICDGNWYRITMGLYGATCECNIYDNPSSPPIFTWTNTYGAGPVDSVVVGQPRSALTSGQTWTTWHGAVKLLTTGFPPYF